MLYPSTISEHKALINNILKNNISIVEGVNPYWNENGKMFSDPDGYRIVISPLKAVN